MVKEREISVSMRGISKTFGSVKANHNVNLDVYKGEILALLGENGSGKTTLMNMLSGIYFPDEGEIRINGELVKISSPKDAYHYHIGMIHQHFKLIEAFNSVENIVLGIKPSVSFWEKCKYFFTNFYKKKENRAERKLDESSPKDAKKKVQEICDKYGFNWI